MLTETSVVYDPILHHDWHVVARSDDLKVNQLLNVNLLGQQVLLWRSKGNVIAWEDRCPHRGVPLSSGWIEQSEQEETIVCPYHGLVFNDHGHCVHIPANPGVKAFPKSSCVRTFNVQERYGFIWVVLGDPQYKIPIFSEWDKPGFIQFNCGPYFINASPLRIVENFTDFPHLPFTHKGLLGSPEYPEISDYRVKIDENGITAHDICLHQPNPDGTGSAKNVSYFCQICRPLVAYFMKGEKESYFSMFIAVTPVKELQSIAWLSVCRNYALETPNSALIEFQNYLMSQDIPMLESQRPQRLPLDLQAEFHFTADKLAVAYRKWLKQMGLKFGTC